MFQMRDAPHEHVAISVIRDNPIVEKSLIGCCFASEFFELAARSSVGGRILRPPRIMPNSSNTVPVRALRVPKGA
jgi:hypothetical protein